MEQRNHQTPAGAVGADRGQRQLPAAEVRGDRQDLIARYVLWVDCGAAAAAGIAMLSLAGWLSNWYALPVELLRFNGLVNLAYGAYSFSLAVRRRRPLSLIMLLAAANMTWFVVCIALAARFSGAASGFGLAHLLGEGSFVAVLAWLEWTRRGQLTNRL